MKDDTRCAGVSTAVSRQSSRRRSWLAALITAACILSTAAQTAQAYGPLVHALTAYKARNESAAALGRWSHGFDRRTLSATMAGTLVHDLGYSNPRFELFSELLHYQETGAFVDRFLGHAVAGGKREAIAFGLGLALHHAGDRQGHDWATNRIVARLAGNKAALLDRLAYEDGMDAHTCVERWIDAIAVSDRKLLPEAEFREFLVVLDGFAGYVEDREGLAAGLLSAPLSPLAPAIEITYGISVPALVNAVGPDAAYLAWPSAYRRALRGAEIAIGIAEELYGLKVDYSKLKSWQKVPSGILEHFYKECGTLRGEVERIARDTGWVAESIDKSTALYSRYLAGMEKTPGAARTIWAQGKRPPDVNLDTNLLSARGEYRLADQALEELEKRGGKIAAASEYANIRMRRSGAYFEKIEPARIADQVLALDGMERADNRVTAPGRAAPSALPDPLPHFRIGPTRKNCESAPPIRLSKSTTIRVTKSRVCLAPGSTVLAAWIGALAAAERASRPAGSKPADWRLVYRGTCYAYFPRAAKSKLDDVAQCLGP